MALTVGNASNMLADPPGIALTVGKASKLLDSPGMALTAGKASKLLGYSAGMALTAGKASKLLGDPLEWPRLWVVHPSCWGPPWNCHPRP